MKNDLGVDREDAVERLNALKQLIGYDKDSEIVKATQKSLDMAIKALEQEQTTKNDLGVDLISRADVLKLMKDNWHTHNGDWAMQESMDDIRALPSVTPQEPRWIPVSERLPKTDEYVGNVAKYYLVQNEYGDMLVARYTHSEYWEQIYQLKPVADEIVAWMPLPEPFEPQESEEQE